MKFFYYFKKFSVIGIFLKKQIRIFEYSKIMGKTKKKKKKKRKEMNLNKKENKRNKKENKIKPKIQNKKES